MGRAGQGGDAEASLFAVAEAGRLCRLSLTRNSPHVSYRYRHLFGIRQEGAPVKPGEFRSLDSEKPCRTGSRRQWVTGEAGGGQSCLIRSSVYPWHPGNGAGI